MLQFDRRSLLRLSSMAAAGSPLAVAWAAAAQAPRSERIASQVQREAVWDFFRSFYGDKDACNAAGFLSHFAKSPSSVYQDATLALVQSGYDQIASVFTGALGAVLAQRGPGRFSKILHATGDMRYGAVAEFVDPQGTFYSTNGFTVQAVCDFDNGLIARNTDYWDARELGPSDLVGPAVTDGVALPVGTVHAGGTPISASVTAPPGLVDLAQGITGRASASPGLLRTVQSFHEALRHGSAGDVAEFFTEDATYVNPLIHQGPALYPNYDRTLQIRGRRLIAQLFSNTLEALPDCRQSSLTHVVGGASGGGFEWKAGGYYANAGINRDGLVGCTALDLFDGKIQRMSVKFDTFQMPPELYKLIRSALLAAGIVDQ